MLSNYKIRLVGPKKEEGVSQTVCFTWDHFHGGINIRNTEEVV